MKNKTEIEFESAKKIELKAIIPINWWRNKTDKERHDAALDKLHDKKGKKLRPFRALIKLARKKL